MRDYEFSFFLDNLLVFLEIIVEIRPTAQFKNCTEAVVVDLHRVVMSHHSAVRQLFMDLILAQSMLDVVILDLITPTVVKVVNLAGNLTAILQVKSLIDLREATLAQD